MTDEKILTLKQYKDRHCRYLADKYNISFAKAQREYPEAYYRMEYRDYVVESFDNGCDIPTRLWHSFDDGLQYRILRSSRALRDNELTHKLASERIKDRSK